MSPATKPVDKSVDKSDGSTLVMQAQPHGGALRRGGPSKGSGRRPSAIRKAALKMLSDRLHIVGALADGVAVEFVDGGGTKLVSPKPGERIQALKLLTELGMGNNVGVGEVRDRLARQIGVIRSKPTWTADELLEVLGDVWR